MKPIIVDRASKEIGGRARAWQSPGRPRLPFLPTEELMIRKTQVAGVIVVLAFVTAHAKAQEDPPPSPDVPPAPRPTVPPPPSADQGKTPSALPAPDPFQTTTPGLRNGWQADFQFLWLKVAGLNERHGDIIRDNLTAGSGSTSTEEQTREGIQSHLDGRFSFRGALEYREEAWSAGISGWWFTSSGGSQGHVQSPPPSGKTTFTSFVLLFEDGRGPTANQNDPSGNAPDDYFTSDKLRSFTTDLYGSYTIAEGPRGWLDLTFGAKLGGLDTTQAHGLGEHSVLLSSVDALGNTVTLNPIYSDHLSLTSTASSNFFGGGPLWGVRGGLQCGDFGIRWFLTQSVLIGNARLRGAFTDIDNIDSSPVLPALGFQGPGAIRSDTCYANSKTTFVPVSEAQLKFTYALGSNVSVGLGGFVSLWWNCPVSPTWAMPTVGAQQGQGQTNIIYVGNWTEQLRNLSFLGGFVELAVQF
jgi:hypothetical protein